MSRSMASAGLAAVMAAGLGLSGCSTLSKIGGREPASPPPSRSATAVSPSNACADFTVSIYFAFDVYSLTRENRAVLDTAAARTMGCRLDSINVVGLSDPVGSPTYNLTLSQRRSDAVREALAADGLGNVTFDAAGEAGAQKTTGQVDPMRRRADILISLSPMP